MLVRAYDKLRGGARVSSRTILVVEDDAAIREGVVDALGSEGFATHEAADGESGELLAVRGAFDLVLLDVMLPGRDGLAVLKGIRAVHPNLPVILLTARGAEEDKVRGLGLGADDYVVKPFSARELLARVAAVLRRSPERPAAPEREVPFEHGVIDLERCELRFADGERCELSVRERELLGYLVRNAGRALTRIELLSNVWRLDPEGLETRTVDMHVARLREKLRDDPDAPRIVLTVRGKGYMFARDGAG
jgi:DNA-binding response OmpR family regulator